MLMWKTTRTSPEALGAVIRRAQGEVECLVGADGAAALVTCQRGSPPDGVEQIDSCRVYSAGDFGPDGGPWVFAVGIWTPQEWGPELCAWYQDEHAPMLMECRDWKGVDLREAPSRSGRQFHVLHRLADRSALDSPQRAASRRTPWFDRLARHSWFDGPFERILYRRMDLA